MPVTESCRDHKKRAARNRLCARIRERERQGKRQRRGWLREKTNSCLPSGQNAQVHHHRRQTDIHARTHPFLVHRFCSRCFSDQDRARPVDLRKERTVSSQDSKHSRCMNRATGQASLLQMTLTESCRSVIWMSCPTTQVVGTAHRQDEGSFAVADDDEYRKDEVVVLCEGAAGAAVRSFLLTWFPAAAALVVMLFGMPLTLLLLLLPLMEGRAVVVMLSRRIPLSDSALSRNQRESDSCFIYLHVSRGIYALLSAKI